MYALRFHPLRRPHSHSTLHSIPFHFHFISPFQSSSPRLTAMATRFWLRPARALIASTPARAHALAVPRAQPFAFRPAVRALHTCQAVRVPAPPLAEVLPPHNSHKAESNSGGSSIGGADNASGNGSNSSAAGGRSWSTRIGVAFFLSTAAFALYLGTWQVKRRAWKEESVARGAAQPGRGGGTGARDEAHCSRATDPLYSRQKLRCCIGICFSFSCFSVS